MSQVLAVYPYTRSYAPFLKAPKMGVSSGICEEILLCPNGFGIVGTDAGKVDLREEVGVVVREDVDEAFVRSDILLVPDGVYTGVLKKDILRRMEEFILRGKSVYYYANYDEEVQRLLGELVCPSISGELLWHPKRLYHPEASVVFVGELFGSVNGTDVALALHDHFNSNGYRVSTFLASRIAPFFGLHTAEELFPCSVERIEQRIDYINNFLRDLEKTECPEVIVVQIPGGLISVNDIVTSEYGIYAYMISQVIKPDAFVLCSPYDQFDKEMFDKFNLMFTYRFGFEIDIIHMSNAKPSSGNMLVRHELDWTYVSLARVDRYIASDDLRGLHVPVYNVLTKHDRMSLCLRVEDTLAGMGTAVAVQTNIRPSRGGK